jgi:LmbE family N-acetylglucosaminyl deacetylase
MRVVAIGAHPDDIEIGCAGTIRKHVESGDEVVFIIATGGGAGGGGVERRKQEGMDAANILGIKACAFLDYEDTKVPETVEVSNRIEEIFKIFKPDRAYIPYHHEIHQDHRAMNKASIVACRNVPQVLMYEGPSTFTDFQANYHVNIDNQVDFKIRSLKAHMSQGDKEILKNTQNKNAPEGRFCFYLEIKD